MVLLAFTSLLVPLCVLLISVKLMPLVTGYIYLIKDLWTVACSWFVLCELHPMSRRLPSRSRCLYISPAPPESLSVRALRPQNPRALLLPSEESALRDFKYES